MKWSRLTGARGGAAAALTVLLVGGENGLAAKIELTLGGAAPGAGPASLAGKTSLRPLAEMATKVWASMTLNVPLFGTIAMSGAVDVATGNVSFVGAPASQGRSLHVACYGTIVGEIISGS